MTNLTEGSVTRHLIVFSGFIAIGMVLQTLYFLADLYWVGRLGKESIAAVSLVGTLGFLVLALTHMLGVGTATVTSHAAGAGSTPRAIHAFYLIPDMTIAVLFGELCRRAVRRAARLGNQFKTLIAGPRSGQGTDFNVELAELLVHLQVLDSHEIAHLLFLNPEP